MSAAKQVREAILRSLAEVGVEAVEAYERERFSRLTAPIAVVGARKSSVAEVGMLDYLGERWSEEKGMTEEVYGRAWKMTISLDVFSPRECSAAPCEDVSEAVTVALISALPSGLRVETLTWEETVWDKDYGLFLRRGSADFSAYFLAAAGEDETVVEDFILKGVMTT